MIELLSALLMWVLFFWTFYNLPIVVVGVRKALKKKRKVHEESSGKLPFVSIVIPARDEETVVGRCLESVVKLDYPKELFEVVVVEDGSTDSTVSICEGFEKDYPDLVRLVRNPVSRGKPAALNYALRFVQGDVVAVFDADNVPEVDVLIKAVRYFDEESVGAVQGKQRCLNRDQNMLTKLVSFEGELWSHNYLRGKDALGLFVSVTGSCYFVRKDVLLEVGGWDSSSLSEDMELSANLANHDYGIRYAPEVCSWQENPGSAGSFFNQRVRWFRGSLDAGIQYGKLMKKPNLVRLDAEITLFGPLFVAFGLFGYLFSLFSGFVPFALDSFLASAVSSGLISFSLMLIGLGLVFVNKPRSFGSLLWVPFIYFYWMLQTFIASFALFQLVFRRPKRWIRTAKTGKTTEF